MSAMTKPERDELARLVRQQARVQRTAAAERAAALKADFEAQLQKRYSWDEEETWASAYKAAKDQVADMNCAIKATFTERGIPMEFAPGLSLGWYERGRNMLREERAEMRRLAHAQIEAAEKKARTDIEAASVALQTELVAGALSSEAARAFLAKLPRVEDLMPTLKVDDIKALTHHKAAA